MNRLLLLFCFILGGVHGDEDIPSSPESIATPNSTEMTGYLSSVSNIPDNFPSTPAPTALSKSTKRPHTPPPATPGPKPTTPHPHIVFYWKECAPVLMVTGGLIIACTILLISTLLLACKVCQLSARLKVLSSDGDLISNSEYWMGTARKNKSKAEAEPKETSVLMSDIGQPQEDMGNGREEGGKGNPDGPAGKETKKEEGEEKTKEAGEKKKEVEEKEKKEAGEQKKDVGEEKKENAADSNETQAGEKSPSSNLKDGAADSQQSKEEASTSESKEEPKDAK